MSWATAWAERRPVFRFVGLFVLLVAAYYGLSVTPIFRNSIFPAYLEATAAISVGLLNSFGEQARSLGTSIVSPRFALEIRRGCDAVEPSAFLVAAIVAFPVPWRFRVAGILAGVPFLMLANLARIVSLYYVGIRFPSAFHAFHVEVWQPLFIFLGVASWIVWAIWTGRRLAATHAA